MNYSICSFLVMIAFVCTSCASSSTTDDNNADTAPDSATHNVSIDTIHQSDLSVNLEVELNKLRAVADWKIADFIVSPQYKTSESVSRTIKHHVEDMKNVKNPFVATYKGCDMGDYFHLIFEDSAGKSYDFGFGNNQFGDYVLCNNDITDNPKYLGKSFVIYWNWEISKFPCCDGENDWVEAYMPSITKLELGESNTDKK